MWARSMAASIAFLLLIGCSDANPSGSGGGAKKVPVATAGVGVSDELPYTLETVLSDIDVPWEMDIAPDGRIFYTERPGNVRVIVNGKLQATPVISLSDEVVSKGEGGLLGLALDPAFAKNGFLYIYHTYSANGDTSNRVLRLKTTGNAATIDKVLIDGLPGAANHNGGRIKFGPDGYLYITAGDRYEPPLAQDARSFGGKILRIAADGSIPPDNPWPGSPVYSMGHRNAQGLAWHPDTGRLYASEHGQSAYDEINLIQPGANYGWPLIEGDERSTDRPELLGPIVHSGGDTTWAPSGMAFVQTGPWRGQLLVANLRGQQLLRVTLNGTDPAKVDGIDRYLQQLGRIRNVYAALDGSLYLMTNNRDGRGTPNAGDDKLIRLRPNFH